MQTPLASADVKDDIQRKAARKGQRVLGGNVCSRGGVESDHRAQPFLIIGRQMTGISAMVPA